MIGEHINGADIVVLPEARVAASAVNGSKRETLDVMKLPCFHFLAADGGAGIAVYVRKAVMEKLGLSVEFPVGSRLGSLLGSVVDIKGDGLAVVGVYAPNMQVSNRVMGAGPQGCEAFDKALFEYLDKDVQQPVVALVGDLIFVWESESKGTTETYGIAGERRSAGLDLASRSPSRTRRAKFWSPPARRRSTTLASA